MKKLSILMICMFMACMSTFAQVKTFNTVAEDEEVVVNASDCKEDYGTNYRLWVRYDYRSPKLCKQAAKREGVKGKPVRVEYLYEYDEPLLKYRILKKVYYDKKDQVIEQVNFENASWNSIGDLDYSLKIGIYMTGQFHIVAG